MADHRSHPLDAILARLPFHVDETDRVNDVFLRWQQHGGAADKQVVDLWTYAFVHRYFAMKFMQRPGADAAALDLAVAQAFKKAQTHVQAGRQIERYASWVSVICRNTFINYLRAQQNRQVVSIDALPHPNVVLAVAPPELSYDEAVLERLLRTAIARLPASLRQIAHLRFVENWRYERISTMVKMPLPQVRTYAHRARTKLREDAHLLTYFRQGPPDTPQSQPSGAQRPTRGG